MTKDKEPMDLYAIQMLGKSDPYWITLTWTWKKTYKQAKRLLDKYAVAWTDYKLRIVHYHKEILPVLKHQPRKKRGTVKNANTRSVIAPLRTKTRRFDSAST